MKFASIDIGSNTILMLLTDFTNNRFNSELNFYAMPRISKGLSESNKFISNDKIKELIDILKDYKEKAINYGAEIFLINATNAFRISSNGIEIKNLIKKELDLDIQIISGNEEAYLSFIGASGELRKNQNRLVIDIGGGSTELIFGNFTKVKYKKSFSTGVVSLTERYLMNDYGKKNQSLVYNHLNNIFDFEEHIPKNVSAIAVAGTPTSIVCMINNKKEYDNSFVEGNKIYRSQLTEIITKMSHMNPNQITEEFGEVVKGRNDVIFSGALILNFIMSKLDLNEIIVSAKGLRYGAVLDYIVKKKL